MSNTFSKPITSHTLYFQMPVHKVISADMDYDTFCDRFMSRRTLSPMTETDDEYETRCEEAWTKVWNALKSKGYHEFPMGYEDDEGEDELQQEMDDYINSLIETDEDDEYAALENAERRRQVEERDKLVNAKYTEMKRVLKDQAVKDARELLQKQQDTVEMLQKQIDALLLE
jgi:hypothetical protein